MLAVSAAALLMLSGCVDILEQDDRFDSGEFISFRSAIDTTTHIGTKSTGDYFILENEYWPVEALAGKTPTKATPVAALSGSAGIIGYNFNGSWTDSVPVWGELNKKEFRFSGNTLSAASDPVSWVKAGNTYLRIYAYFPKTFVDDNTTITAATGAPSLSYTVSTNVAEQQDILVAKSADKLCSEKTPVDLVFTHALTAVKFSVGFTCKVKKVSVKGVYKYGEYSMDYETWSNQSLTEDFEIAFDGEGKSCNKGEAITDGELTLMMIPQTIPDGATIELEYNDGSDHTISASIAGQTWDRGKRITYKIYKETPSVIYFDLAAGSVTISSSYSGAIYCNNGAEVHSVTGTHKATNKYYVYQSSANSESTNGYYVNTGYEGEYGAGDVRVPSYSEISTNNNGSSWNTSGSGITWREYITNHKRSTDLIDLQADGAAAHPFKTVQKRTGTTNTIYTSGTGVDITIDNLWCSNTTINGTAPFRFNGSTTLRLKGDSFVTKIITESNSYFYLTSYKGDGSEEGSITITPFTRTFAENVANPQSAILFHNNNPANIDKMAFKGGTVYAATTIGMRDHSYRWVSGGISASSNQQGCLEISGGAVTVVAFSNGAALGGGGGMIGQAGSGHIRITGGRTFVYQGGVTTNTEPQHVSEAQWARDYRFPLTSTAIGGGSTFCGNPTTGADLGSMSNGSSIEIGGDAYVYVECVGGVAIGGGSSGGLRGGLAQVSIGVTGNPTVIAKSVPGRITDPFDGTRYYDVPAGTAIGGGNGGDENHKVVNSEWNSFPEDEADGGMAQVTIRGGWVYTGSLGGGSAGKDPDGNPRKLGSAEIVVSGGIIQGQFVMQAGAAAPPTFTMTGGTIDNEGLTTSRGFYKIKDDGGAVFIGAGTNPGSFDMSGGIIQNCSAVNGGVVYQADGSCSISGTAVIRNSRATNGGGAVYISGSSNPTFTMSDGEISGCRADYDGGAVYLEGGSVTITDGTIRRNKALGGSGGGICINKGSFTMSDGAINGNYADVNGGGVYISSDDTNVSATVSGGTITENTSEKWGGGLCILPGGISAANVTLGATGRDELSGLLTNPDISGNRSKFAGGGVYTAGSKAYITINSGKINGNQVTAYVANENVANEGGMVTLLDGDVTHQVVTFHANGEAVGATAYFGTQLEGTGPTTKIQKIVTSTNSKLVAPTVYYCAGFHFNGWNSRPDGLGETYTNDQVMNITENVDLYIQWEIN